MDRWDDLSLSLVIGHWLAARDKDKGRLFFLRQQFLDPPAHDLLALGFLPIQLSVPAVAHIALLVDQVDRGPVMIVPRLPRLARTVHSDRVLHPVLFDL